MIFIQSRRNAIQIEGERSSTLEMARGRLVVLGAFFVLVYLIIAVRAFDLGVLQGDMRRLDPVQQEAILRKSASPAFTDVRRGNIYDREGVLLATTVKFAALFADPYLIIEPEKVARGLAKIFPDLKYADLAKSLKQEDARFVWLKRRITPEQQAKVLELGEPGLEFVQENTRVYPQGDLVAHLVGFTDRDGVGLAGVERSFNHVLAKGENVQLTLDVRLQYAVRREVSTAISEFTAKGGAGIVMDAKTGEVLAGVSLPDFDLNVASVAVDDQRFNRLTLGVYELGSMFKIFSTAALFENFDVGMGKTFDARKPLKMGRHTINDYHAQKRIMTVPEVFMHSSNIGTAMMGQMVGGDNLRKFYSDLGLLHPVKFDVKEIGKPVSPNPWREISTLTASYGHGVSTTPLQMTAAVASVVNGGIAVYPALVQPEKKGSVKSEVRLLSEDTSLKMRKLLRLVVTQGTGKNADVAGFSVGGKTGTAEKSVNGRYDRNKLISSFIGAFPMQDPRYVIMVMVDEPVGNKKSYGYATAGWVAAPTFGRIVTSMASILGIPATSVDEAQEISADLMQYVHDPAKKEGKKLVSYKP